MTPTLTKTALFAGSIAALMTAAAIPARAAQTIGDHQVVYVDPTGTSDVVGVNTKGHDMMMKQARPLAAGAMIYRSGGKLYLLEDKQMASGKMLFDGKADWLDRAVGGIR